MTRVEPWHGLDLMLLGDVRSDGRVDAVPTRLLDAAARRNTLDELAGQVEAALRRLPRWLAGKALLGMIRVRQGRTDQAKRLLEDHLADPNVQFPPRVLLIVGQELSDDPALQPLAMTAYERAFKSNTAWGVSVWGFTGGRRLPPGHTLRAGRPGRGDAARCSFREWPTIAS